VVWTTIASGVPPEVHGITGFYSTQAHLRAKRVWEIFSELGLRVGVFRWWASWPPRELNGFLIPGVLAQSAEALPEEYDFVNRLRIGQRAGQRMALWEWGSVLGDYLGHGLRFSTARSILFELAPALLARDPALVHIAKRRAELRLNFDVYSHMLRAWQPDYTSFYDNGIDVLGHYYWKYFEPEAFSDVETEESSRYGTALPDYYRLVDQLLGELLRRIDPRSAVLVLSDHGMQAAKRHGSRELIPLVDRILKDMKWNDRYFGIVLANRTFIELKQTDSGEAERDIAALAGSLRELTVDESGQALFELRVIDSQRIEISITPDVELKHHVDTGSELVPISSWLSQRPGKSGDHHPTGILIARGFGVERGHTIEGATILDVAPTLLALARAPIGEDMPGRVLVDLFTPAYLERNPVRTIPSYGSVDPESQKITMDEQTKSILRSLGYVQ
jgi:hypothetical protein